MALKNMKTRLLFAKFFTGLFCALLLSAPLLALPVRFVSATPPANNAPANNAPPANSECGELEQQGPLCFPKNPFANSANSLVGQTTATGLIAAVIRILLYFAGIIAVLFLIIGGYFYLTSRGNEEQATKGRQTLVYALLGLAIVILSYVIVTVLTNQLTSNV